MMKHLIALLFIVLMGVIAGLKCFSFRHVGSDDPTVSLFLGEWMVQGNAIRGQTPAPIADYTLLAQSENGFVGEAIYAGAMHNAWVVVIVMFLATVLLLSPRRG